MDQGRSIQHVERVIVTKQVTGITDLMNVIQETGAPCDKNVVVAGDGGCVVQFPILSNRGGCRQRRNRAARW